MFKAPMIKGRVSIVIPHWNAKPLLHTCLTALRNQTYSDIEIIVADNASTDGSQAYIREHFPEVIIEQLPTNRGFTGACNAGIRVSSGEYIALLNNDTEVEPTWVAELVSAFERHPEAGFLASKMLLFDQRDHFHTAGDYYRVDGRPGNRGVWQKDIGQYNQEEYVFSACGGSSIYRRTMLEQIGLLDDDFFFSCEDLDLAWRAQFAGYKCLYVPTAIVYHQLSASGGGVTASFYDGRNSLFLLMKDYPTALWRKYWRYILKAQWQETSAAIKAWRGKAARATLRGKLSAIRYMPKMLAKRRQVQRNWQVTLDYIESILTPIEADL
ncbi:MAG: glycosyltransferase family 2 protein [Phototrophicales bacterium]|nr:MAG: glycosyltransferase family 2 protein [Phototrophicales bacterium]